MMEIAQAIGVSPFKNLTRFLRSIPPPIRNGSLPTFNLSNFRQIGLTIFFPNKDSMPLPGSEPQYTSAGDENGKPIGSHFGPGSAGKNKFFYFRQLLFFYLSKFVTRSVVMKTFNVPVR